MEALTNKNVIKDLMVRNGFTFSKALGQNFIVDPFVCPEIAIVGGAGPDVGVIEIGAGIGVLTAELARQAKKVVSIEIDSRLLPILAETLEEFNNIKIINSDVLKVNLHELIKEEFEGMDVVVCANLPYYITSPIIMSLLEQRLDIKSITVMVQKEAGLRICATPGTRACGAISAAVSYYSAPQIVFQVERNSFMPAPAVDSSVIRLDIHKEPPVSVQTEAMLFRVIKGSFCQRRKTILNTLSSTFAIAKDQMREILAVANVIENARAETLSLEDFARIADAIEQHNKS